MKNSTVSCYIIEEHNEALSIWINAIKKKEINGTGNLLLHFDDHSDMTALRFNKSIKDIYSWDNSEICDFVKNNTSIASFIIASCYLKIFDEINWIQYDGNKSSKEAYVTTYNDDGKNIISGSFYEGNPLLKFDHHIFRYSTFSSKDFFNSYELKNNNYLLDIDLDFFSCETQPENKNEVIIEITKSEYKRFNENDYHSVRFLVNRAETMHVEGRFYLVLNYYKDIFPSPRKNNKSEIDTRINDFIENMELLPFKPKLITICRSRYSGYTPDDQWKYIETKIIKYLKKRFSIQINYINGK